MFLYTKHYFSWRENLLQSVSSVEGQLSVDGCFGI